MGKIAAMILLTLFVSGYEICQTTDARYRISKTLLANVNNIQAMIPETINIKLHDVHRKTMFATVRCYCYIAGAAGTEAYGRLQTS